MRILIVGKYPPIQGGVSRSVYWAAQTLAQQGHTVRVLTNAMEAEYGIRQMLYGEDEAKRLAFDGVHKVEVISTYTPERFRYLPYANPFVSKLAGLIERSLEEFRPDVVVASYFEPYCVATAFATMGRDIPVLMTHAGSDLATLAKFEDLRPTYRRTLQRADRVLSLINRPGVATLLEGLGIQREKILFTFGNAIEPIFTPGGPQFDLEDALSRMPAHLAAHAPFEPEIVSAINAINSAPIDPDRPKFAIFGKVGLKKGSFQLLESVSRMAARGHRIHLHCIACGHETMITRFVRMVAADPHLRDAVRILAPVTHWRIADFVRSMDACFFLEHEFPVGIHSPRVALEVLLSGTPLILAGEQAARMRIGQTLQAGEHYVPVANPSKPEDLDAAIAFALADPARLKAIGEAGMMAGRAYEATRKTWKQRIVQSIEMLYPGSAPGAGI